MQNYNVGIYCRLSREDGNEESQSIQSQREILTEYVKKQGWKIVDVYVDDGYSGTNFVRPSFMRLVDDIKAGRVDLVITKDLSRLGRNYIQAGYYTEEFFPEHNVRYIALNDNVDTAQEESGDFAPFKNIINEWYAKDISKKIRFTLDNKAKNGEPRNTVFAIFGYTYNAAFERVPDAETAQIVRLIYRKFVEFGSSVKVAQYLKNRKIKTPRYYNAIKFGYNKDKVLSMSEEKLTDWKPSGVRDIIAKREYLGCYITAQSKSQSYKNKKRQKNKDCYVFEKRYEPLIDEETWQTANRILRRTRSGKIPMEENLLKGLMFCADCHKLMRFERRKDAKRGYIYRYFCANKDCRSSNSIPLHTIMSVVKFEMMTLVKLILSHQENLIESLKNTDKKGRTIKLDTTGAIEKLMKRSHELDLYIQMLFEKRASEILPDSTYKMMMEKYRREKELLTKEIEELSARKTEDDKKFDEVNFLLKQLKAIGENDDLLKKVIQRVVKKIEVKSCSINNSNKNKNYEISLVFARCDDILGVNFDETKNSNLC